jgi:putative transposase
MGCQEVWDDTKIFLEKLCTSVETYNVDLLVFVRMTNQFHRLVFTPEGNLAEFMRHFNISYTSLFSRRHNRVGHLYQGRYQSFLMDADTGLSGVHKKGPGSGDRKSRRFCDE